MIVEFNVITDILSLPDNEGNQKVVKKNVIYKKEFESTNSTLEHFINSKGEILKSYSVINYNGSSYKVKHTFDYCKNKLRPLIVKGFLGKMKKK